MKPMGELTIARRGGPHPTFAFPLHSRSAAVDFLAPAGYVDQDPAFPDQLLDFACGERTYDLANGYNHRGNDFALWPYWWHQMDSEDVEVRAMAAGQVIDKRDGEFDRQCTFNDDPTNFVAIQHADGSVTLYFHLKNGSVTEFAVGRAVVTGEYLGLVGSSGSSVIPHLHIETYYPGAPEQLIEPFAGTCNALNGFDGWWDQQPPYMDKRINQLSTHDVAPSAEVVYATCQTEQDPHYANSFDPGQPVWMALYFRDLEAGDSTSIELRDPDAALIWSDTFVADETRETSWAAWEWSGSLLSLEGDYQVTAQLLGQVLSHNFEVGPLFRDGFNP